jgi:signal peptidase I
MAEEKKDSITETVKTVIYAVLLALLIRSVAFEPFNIPSGSMLPNLLVGDYLFVSKYSYGYSRYSFPLGIAPIEGRWWYDSKPGQPQVGDKVVFKLPTNPSINYIKRLVGKPGDTIQVKEGRLYINNKLVERKLVGASKMGNEELTKYEETLPNGVKHFILERSDEEALDDTDEYKVPAGHYFMMGDNRDNSADSRVKELVGFVPAENLLGPARFIFFSLGEDFDIRHPWDFFGHIRYSRMFRSTTP